MEANPSGARTLERGLSLLDHVAAGAHRLEDITQASGLSRSATHRMLTSLVAGRYLSQQADHSYHLGIKLLELGTKAEANISLPDAVQSILAGIAKTTQDTTHLGILSGDDVLYLAKARGHRGIEMASRPGARLRAQNTAMGKALLAAQRDIDEAVSAFDTAAIATPRSIQSADAFRAVLGHAREDGYALDDQENELGITCVAIAIPDLLGKVAAAVSISAPSVYMTPERIESLVALLKEAQPELSRCLPPGFERAWI
jgi:IclR family acetate operon transcriptional repressor